MLVSAPPKALTKDDKIVISGADDPHNNGEFKIAQVGIEGKDEKQARTKDIYLEKVLSSDQGTGARAEMIYDGDRYEFIELKNTGDKTLDLSGVYFSRGIKYAFPVGSRLAPGGFWVIVKNAGYFKTLHPSVAVDGIYDPRSLSNKGETLELMDRFGQYITRVRYRSKAPWPLSADGMGKSLVTTSSNPSGYQNDPSKWRASTKANGSPGADDPKVSSIAKIVINEVLTHTDKPQRDTIELYNPSDSSVNIGGWHLSDRKNNPGKWTIPSGIKIGPKGYKVFYEGHYAGGILKFNGREFGSAFSLSSLGDAVYIVSPKFDYMHGFKFRGSWNGRAFGRHVNNDGIEQFPEMVKVTLGSANSKPKVGSVVITEIMYHPDNNDPDSSKHDHEFIEIKNISKRAVRLYSRSGDSWGMGGIRFYFPPKTQLRPGEVNLLVKDTITPAKFRKRYNIPALVDIYAFSGKLSNGGETIRLMAPDEPLETGPNAGKVAYIVIDEVKYSDGSPWPASADGKGKSLERKNVKEYGNESSNWKASRVKGGTPGR